MADSVHSLRRAAVLVHRVLRVRNEQTWALPATWNCSAAARNLLPRATVTDSVRSRRLRATKRREAHRARRQRAAAAAPTGTGLRRVRWNRAATVRPRAATAADHRPVRSWICGSRSCGLLRTADIRVGAIAALRATADRAEHLPATVARAELRAMEVVVIRAPRVAGAIPARLAAAATLPGVEVGTLRAVAATPAAVIARSRRCCKQRLYNELL